MSNKEPGLLVVLSLDSTERMVPEHSDSQLRKVERFFCSKRKILINGMYSKIRKSVVFRILLLPLSNGMVLPSGFTK